MNHLFAYTALKKPETIAPQIPNNVKKFKLELLLLLVLNKEKEKKC